LRFLRLLESERDTSLILSVRACVCACVCVRERERERERECVWYSNVESRATKVEERSIFLLCALCSVREDAITSSFNLTFQGGKSLLSTVVNLASKPGSVDPSVTQEKRHRLIAKGLN
ncbi:hypothetical protein F2P56_033767, partial [Juglans regia]